MAARGGITYIVDEVRRLSGAGTAEFTAGTVTFFSDDEIERLLDSRRVRMARYPVTFEYEKDYAGSGSIIYHNSFVDGFSWLEDVVTGGSADNFIVTDARGSLIGTANYTLSPEDGHLKFSADQKGSSRFVTGWLHNPYMGAMDVLTSWQTQLAQQPDWETDNMKVRRSQKSMAVARQIKWLKSLAGWAPQIKTVPMERGDTTGGDW